MKKTGTRLAFGLVALLLAALAVPAASEASGGGAKAGSKPTGRGFGPGLIGHQGRWLTDGQGRVVLLNGVNLVAKGALTPEGRGFGADDADFLVANGFDAVRLGLSPDAFMPTPGKVDQTYLQSYARTVRTLTDRGLLVLVDLHQDGWGPSVCGNGFPAWMTRTHGATNTCTTFPLYYVTNPAIQAAFQSLWDDEQVEGAGLQDHVATMFEALAGAVGDDPNVLGYDILNEPWPGTSWQDCALKPNGCPDLDAAGLDELHTKVAKAIRTKDPKHLIFGEPYVLFNFGNSLTHVRPPNEDPRAGLSWHMYTSPELEPNVPANAITWSNETGGALLNTEFGAVSSQAEIHRMVDVLDDALMPWMWWSYDEGMVHDMSIKPGVSNINRPVVDALVRPHAVAVAGTPTSHDYDPATRVLRFSWSTTAPGRARLAPGATSVIRVPKPVYGGRYTVEVQGGSVVSPPGAVDLTIATAPGARTVTVTVRPAP